MLKIHEGVAVNDVCRGVLKYVKDISSLPLKGFYLTLTIRVYCILYLSRWNQQLIYIL